MKSAKICEINEKKMNQNQLKTEAEKAAARTEAWMLQHIADENLRDVQ